MFKPKKLFLFLLCSGIAIDSLASTFFFPEINPTITTVDAPKWLREGHGNDGYVTVTSDVIPTSSCVPLSNHSFWGGEKTQLILSINTHGFQSKFDSSEIPIATFDGRDNGSECASLSTLPINVVPFAVLGSFSLLNPGSLNLTLNVKSTSDSNQDFIGSAKLVLGAAALVVSGGVGATIGGITATVSNPVLSETQTRTNNLLKGMVNGKTPITLTWPKLRKGLQTIEIPVYRAEGSLGSTPDKKIQELQTDSKAEKTKLFTVRLTFSYANNLFDPSIANISELQNSEVLSTSNVLNHPMMNGGENFLQLLNSTSPSLLMSIANAEGHELSNACSIGLDKLKKNGLSNADMAIVMKSFIDEAKGGNGWYNNPALVKSCFIQAPNVETMLEQIYGVPAPKFVIGDVQDGVGKAYRDWRDLIGPSLSAFRKALLAKTDRQQYLLAFNNNHDIDVLFTADSQNWSHPAEIKADTGRIITYPGIEKLVSQNFKTAGCFIYKDATNLERGNPGAYFILEDLNNNYWLGNAKLATDTTRRISKLEISELSPDWANHFASYSYPGGNCSDILSRYKQKINASLDIERSKYTEQIPPVTPQSIVQTNSK